MNAKPLTPEITTHKGCELGWVGPREGCWEWISSHFDQLHYVPLGDANEWSRQHANSLLMVAVDHRTSVERELLNTLWESSRKKPVPQNAVGAKTTRGKRRTEGMPLANESSDSLGTRGNWIAILGESWPGHRRTSPLPDDVHSVYWYELYDRLLPFVAYRQQDNNAWELFQPAAEHGRSIRADRWLHWVKTLGAIPAPRMQVLAVTDTSTEGELWLDLLDGGGVTGIRVDADHWNVGCRPDVVIIDLWPRPSLGDSTRHVHRVSEVLKRASERFRDARIVVMDPFPRWSDWSDWIRKGGADAVFPKPFAIDGIRWSLYEWNKLG